LTQIPSGDTKPRLHPLNLFEVRAGKIQVTGGTAIALKHVLFRTKRYNMVFVPEDGRKKVVTTEFIEILVPDGFRYLSHIPPDTDTEYIYEVAKNKNLIEDEGDFQSVRVCWNFELEGHTSLRTRKMRLVLFDGFPNEEERVIVAWNDKTLRDRGLVYYD